MQVQNINSYPQQNFGALRAKNLSEAMIGRYSKKLGTIITISDPPTIPRTLPRQRLGSPNQQGIYYGETEFRLPTNEEASRVYHIRTEAGSQEQAAALKDLREQGFEVA